MQKKSSYPGQLVFGLDIGTRSIVGTVGYKEDEQFYVVAQAMKEHTTRAMLDGQIHDISKVAETIAWVKDALEKDTGRTFQDVCIAAAGRVLQTITVHVEEKYERDHKVVEEDLFGITSLGIEKAYQEFNEKNESDTKFYCVGHSIMQYYLNDYPMNNLIDHKAKSISADLIATFLPDDVVSGLYEAVEKAGLRVANLTLEPIAAIQVAIPMNFRTLNIAMVDVGAGTSDISITNAGSIIGFGMIPYAGDALTEAILNHYLCDFETAERIKREADQNDTVTYTDIMGLSQTIKRKEIQKVVEPVLFELAKRVAAKIKDMNGGKSVSAVFVVGGGGKFYGFCERLSEELEILKERVAIRSVDVSGNIHFLNGTTGSDSLFVTPVGICMNFYEQNNNFIYVTFNRNNVKIYDNGNLTVLDATLQANYPNEDLFPKRGEALHFTVNRNTRVIRGKVGEAPEFFVNGKLSDINTSIHENDKIVITTPEPGDAATMELAELQEFQATISVHVNKKLIELPKFASVNGELKSGFYSIKDGDNIEILPYYTVRQILDFLDLATSSNQEIQVNHLRAELSTPVYDQFSVDFINKSDAYFDEENDEKSDEPSITAYAEDMEINEMQNNQLSSVEETISDETTKEVFDLHVIVNGNPLVIQGKSEYVFVNIFDYIDFDLTKSKGRSIVTKVNGRDAEYMEELHDQDIVEIYWKGDRA